MRRNNSAFFVDLIAELRKISGNILTFEEPNWFENCTVPQPNAIRNTTKESYFAQQV